jgi:hypothetical protein
MKNGQLTEIVLRKTIIASSGFLRSRPDTVFRFQVSWLGVRRL